MNARTLKAIQIERHARQLERALGVPAVLGLCDAAGELVWASTEGQADIAGALAVAAEERGDLCTGSGQMEIEGASSCARLTWVPVLAGSRLAGCLAVLAAGAESETPYSTLEDAGAAIGAELRLNEEVDSLTGELSTRYEELNLVYAFEQHLSRTDEGIAGAQSLLHTLVDFLEVDFAGFVLRGGEPPIYATGDAKLPSFDLVLTALRGDVFRFIVASRNSLVINEPDDMRRQYLLINLPYRLIACPITFGSQVEAMLVMLRRPEGQEFSNGDRSIGEVLARQTGTMLRSRERVETARRFSEQMAGALIEAIEAKDPYTRGHSERVQMISTKLAAAANLTGEDVESVSWGALLHDIGKLGIPDAILCKAGRLSDDEYTLVKIHPERGYEILSHIEGLTARARNAVRHHHEQYDGTGYPKRLGGAAIPVHARVIAVGDTYDAITSSRAYRPGRSHEQALEILREVAGTQLDPQFVDVFERFCEENRAWFSELSQFKSGAGG